MEINIKGKLNFGQIRQFLLDQLKDLKSQELLVDVRHLTLVDYHPGFDNYAAYLSEMIGQFGFKQIAFVSKGATETAFLILLCKNIKTAGVTVKVFNSYHLAKDWL